MFSIFSTPGSASASTPFNEKVTRNEMVIGRVLGLTP